MSLQPHNATRLRLTGRASHLFPIYELKSHPKVNKKKGHRIFLTLGSKDPAVLGPFLEHVAQMQAPKSVKEARDRGFLLLKPSDKPVFLWRDRDGTSDPNDDVWKVWALPKSERSTKDLEIMKKVRDKVYGKDEEMGEQKAYFDKAAGIWRGGVLFECSNNAKNLANGLRCYPLATIHQAPKNMDAPSSGRKGEDSDHARLNLDLLKVGASAGMEGLRQGPETLLPLLQDQADLVNTPRIGTPDNVGFQAFQLNIATAAKRAEARQLKESLGGFGASHIDGGDSAASVTCMSILTRPHPDVEEELFFIFNFGIAIYLSEFSSVLFSGLHYHCGQQVFYKDGRRTLMIPHIRLTLIAYPPAVILDALSSSAIANTPGSGSDGLLKVFRELKDWLRADEWERSPTAQATFTSDRGAVMVRSAHFDHFARNIILIVAFLFSLLPPEYLARFDRDKMLASMTYADNGQRRSASSWKLGPGSLSPDVIVGSHCLSNNAIHRLGIDEQKALRNSDTPTSLPYNNPALQGKNDAWTQHSHSMADTIPICILAAQKAKSAWPVGGLPANRKAINRSLRKNKEKDDEVDALTIETDRESDGPIGKPSRTQCRECGHKSRKPRNRPTSGLSEISADESDIEPRRRGQSSSQSSPLPSLPPAGLRRGRSASRTSPPPPPQLHTPRQSGTRPATLLPPTPTPQGTAPPSEPRRGRSATQASSSAGPSRTRRVTFADISAADSASEAEDGPPRKRQRVDAAMEMPLLSSFNVSDLTAYHLEVKSAVTSSAPSELYAFTTLASDFRAASLPKISQLYRRLLHESSSLSIALQEQRMWRMMMNMAMWEGVAFSINMAYNGFVGQSPAISLSPIFTVISKMISQPLTPWQIDASDYVEGFERGESIYHHAPEGRSDRFVYKHESPLMLKRIAARILLVWHGLPKNADTQAQAVFVRGLIQVVGVSALRYPPVWDAYQHLPGLVSSHRPSSLTNLVHAVRQWSTHALWPEEISNKDGELQAILSTVHALIFQCGLPCPSAKDANRFFSSEAQEIFPIDEDEDVLDHVPAQKLPSVFEEELRKVVTQAEWLYTLLDNPEALVSHMPRVRSQADCINNFVHAVQRHTDLYLPFRDHAASRRRILAPGGPFSPEHLRTVAGLFSALVYRGITHNLPYLRDSNPSTATRLFIDFNHFVSTVKPYESKHICNVSAYGSASRARKPANARSYWEWATQSENNNWLLGGATQTLKFTDAYNKFLKLPAFGTLTAYLLAADYALAGVVEFPSPKEVGRVLRAVRSGGWKSLGNGVFQFDVSSPDATAEAFETYYSRLEAALPVERRVQMGFDVFVAEHMLCKTLRFKEKTPFQEAYEYNSH
ncbi:hypothetical protein BKA70DRAFT_1439101 [Coprinopsis sp. MPI-PUGE-AT-0042]|nr:hypothetical protein BKA70DRAFT_1439101 [Coprinopsis sp. MPI-PUGE-AT-0042]